MYTLFGEAKREVSRIAIVWNLYRFGATSLPDSEHFHLSSSYLIERSSTEGQPNRRHFGIDTHEVNTEFDSASIPFPTPYKTVEM